MDGYAVRAADGAAERRLVGECAAGSAVLPAVEAGAWGVHIPYHITWTHELADAPEGHPRYVSLASISELPAWIAAQD